MPYAKRECQRCGQTFQPKNKRRVISETAHLCGVCIQIEREEKAEAAKRAAWLAERDEAVHVAPALEASRTCEVDGRRFVPPAKNPGERRCPECRRLAERAVVNPFEDYDGGAETPSAPTHLAAPLKQAVFDLETFALDRGWGVLMVGSVIVYGSGEPKQYTFDLTETDAWREGRRSDDRQLGARILKVLAGCHVLYAHNGLNFDIPWLNSIALKYGMPRINAKLVDPVQVARRKYRIGSNSLSNLASFLDLPEEKMPVPAEVWRRAIFDGDAESWRILRERCESDVRLLAMVAGRVTDDVGMIDRIGSFRG